MGHVGGLKATLAEVGKWALLTSLEAFACTRIKADKGFAEVSESGALRLGLVRSPLNP
jgi:hypothetical protein